MLDMVAGRPLADREGSGDLAIADPLGQQAQHLALPRRQPSRDRRVSCLAWLAECSPVCRRRHLAHDEHVAGCALPLVPCRTHAFFLSRRDRATRAVHLLCHILKWGLGTTLLMACSTVTMRLRRLLRRVRQGS